MSEQLKAEWYELPVPSPPGMAEAVGYTGQARYVGVYWEPCGDESCYTDGVSGRTGSWAAYLALVQHRAVSPHIQTFNTGSSEFPAEDVIVIDRAEGKLYVAPRGS